MVQRYRRAVDFGAAAASLGVSRHSCAFDAKPEDCLHASQTQSTEEPPGGVPPVQAAQGQSREGIGGGADAAGAEGS